MTRARAVDPTFALNDANAGAVAAICHRLEGLPLALELAAAQSAVLTPAALLPLLARRLPLLTSGRRDAPARQRTLRDAIAWSYDLLTPDEQRLFRGLAVFVGGVSLEAATGVAARDQDAAYATLAALVEHSLLRHEPGPGGDSRYLMLETIREFALERLDEAGETEAARDAHASWFAALDERLEPNRLDARGTASTIASCGSRRTRPTTGPPSPTWRRPVTRWGCSGWPGRWRSSGTTAGISARAGPGWNGRWRAPPRPPRSGAVARSRD